MDERYEKLNSGEQFLVHKEKIDDNSVILVFMSLFGARILANSSHWLADGTFKTVPAMFSQLYVIFGEVSTAEEVKIMPCVFALLPSKAGFVYEKLMEVVIGEVGCNPTTFSIDFELAMMKAVNKKISECTILGCNFHFKKNIFKNVGTKGCLPLFHDSESFQIGLDLIYQLCMVPAEDIVMAFENVILPFFEENYAEEDEEVQDFLQYVERTYIGKLNPRTLKRTAPPFPHSMVSIHERIKLDMDTTNNAVENWNGRWNRTVGTNHNLWRIINAFKQEDALARQLHQDLVGGRLQERNPGRKERMTSRQKELKRSIESYAKENLKEFMFMMREGNC